jgi:hypothetical protein
VRKFSKCSAVTAIASTWRRNTQTDISVCLETVEEEVARSSNLWDVGDLLSPTPPKKSRKN